MMMKARCVTCRNPLPEFNSKTPPSEIICKWCGAKTTGEKELDKFRERLKQSYDRVNKQ